MRPRTWPRWAQLAWLAGVLRSIAEKGRSTYQTDRSRPMSEVEAREIRRQADAYRDAAIALREGRPAGILAEPRRLGKASLELA